MIPVNTYLGFIDVYGSFDYAWHSLAEMIAAMGSTIPPGASGARIQAHAPLGFSQAPDAVASNPFITPIILADGATLELFDAEQLQQLRIYDDGAYFSVQFYAYPSIP